ncbi:MAG: hypothetical protein LBT29_00920 [Flavobacteriaceae bacterium]|jgi:hypothetical protein|nr:hypothetical protein [Flavobacteriaceae bacterium]
MERMKQTLTFLGLKIYENSCICGKNLRKSVKFVCFSAIFFLINLIHLSAKIQYDSAKISHRKLSNPPSKIYVGKDFVYEDPPHEPNFLERFLHWIWWKITEFLNSLFNWNLRAETPSGRKMLWITLTVLLVALIVVGFLFFWKKFRRTLGRNDRDRISAEEAEKNLSLVDFDRLIDTAYREKNYRLAVRFYYLKILKLLSERQFIQYEYQKTNYEYAYEIQNPQLQNLFKEVSFVFDYCWYGEYRADLQDFILAKQKFGEIQEIAKS